MSDTTRIAWRRARDLAPARLNPKRHDAKAIEASIVRFGFVDPVVEDGRTGRLVSGHGRREAVLELERRGGPPPRGVQVDPADGAWTIPTLVGWSSANDEEADALLLAENAIVEAGGWDLVELGQTIDKVRRSIDLRALGFTKHDLDKAMAKARAAADAGASAVVAPPERPKVAIAKLGDLWLLGNHRLLVGDSTKADDVARLMAGERADAVVTDPPYAIYGSSSGLSSSVTDDKIVRPFFLAVLASAQGATKTFGHVYVFCDWRSWPSWWEVAKGTRLVPKNLLVWDKGAGLGSMYANHHELVGFYSVDPEKMAMQSTEPAGARLVLRPNVVRLGNVPHGDREHNAAKPVDLVKMLVENATDEGELVLDLFAGSGTTLVACEAMKRRCVTLEIDPACADVTIARWERQTGRKAVRAEAAP